MTMRKRVVACLAGLTAVSLILWLCNAVGTSEMQFTYLPWNLFLAWLPLVAAAWLVTTLRTHLWSRWLPFCITLLWLALLPNSFYVVSDFVHLNDVPATHLLFYVVLFTTFVVTALALGFYSVALVHAELKKRTIARTAGGIIAVVLLASSFAIYLGRDLRWNSWDVLLNPAGMLFDISDHLLHPLTHGDMFTTTASFFVLLSSLYFAAQSVTIKE